LKDRPKIERKGGGGGAWGTKNINRGVGKKA